MACLRAEQAHFNPRSPHGERHGWTIKLTTTLLISIHAPRTGSDGGLDCFHLLLGISIHAPRTGSDSSGDYRVRNGRNFNPRSPHGERQTLKSVV